MSDKSLRTLIVDDSEDDVLLIIRELKKGGYNPVYERVETAAKMKKALLENQWDIILCDYRLPRFNAPSAIALLKETNLNLPVIIISGKIGEETAVECMRLGAKDYILKDNLIRLCPAIARELEEAKVRQREKKAEEALRESERKYQLLFDNSIDAIAVFGGKPPKFLFVNPAFLRLFGYTLEEILAFSPDDIFLTIYPDDREMVKEHLRNRFRREDNYNRYEFRVVTKDGQVRWVEISATLFSKNGKFLSQAICRDITERKRMEGELRESEKKYRAFFDTSRDCVYITSTDGKLIDVNDAAIESFGYSSRDELMQLKIPDLYVKKEERPKLINTILEKGFCKDYPVDMRKKDGGVMHTLISATVQYDADGKTTGFMGTIKDITDRKRVEEALLNSYRRLEDIIDFLPDATLVVDRKGKVIAWNRSMERMSKVSKADMIGRKNYEYALPFYGERRPILIDLVMLPDNVFEYSHYENVYRQGDTLFAEAYVPQAYGGKGAFMWGTASRLRNASGNIIGAIESFRDITNHRRMEEKIRESEENYRQLFDNAPTAIYRIDFKSGKLLKANDLFCEYVGCKQEEITSFSPYDILTKESKQLFLERVGKMALGIEVPNPVEYEIIDIKGRRWCVQLQNKNIYDAEGHVVAADVVAYDITERKRAEDEIRKSENKYRTLFESANDIIFLMDQDIFIDCNQKTLDIFGCTREQILGQPPYRFSPKIQPDGRNSKEKTLEKINAVLKGQPQFFEWKFCRYDRSYFDAEVSLNSFKDKNKCYIQAIVRDITDRRRAEDLLSRSEAKYRNIFENAMEGIYQTTMEGRFITANTAFAHMAGYDSSEELIESVKDIATQLYVHPEDRQRVLEIGAKKGFAKSVKIEFYKKDGSIFWAEINARMVRNKEKKILYIEGFIQDVTARKQAQEHLSKSEKKFSSIFHLNSDPMVISDIDTGGIIDVNQAYINWTGYSREEIIGDTGNTLHLWVDPDDRKKIIDKLKVEVKVDGEEIWARQRNGNVRIILISARFIEIDRQFFLLMSGHDITDRKQIEKKLRKSELTFRSLFEASPIGIFTVLNRNFIQVNPAMCKATGYSLEDLIGQSVRLCYWNDEEYERAGKRLYGEITQVGVGIVETRLRRRNGEEFHALICLNPIDPQDPSLGYEGIMMDITERRRAEEEIRRTQEQMRAFAVQLQTVREEERTRIAREIHDELGGALTSIKIDFSLLKKAAAEIKEKALKDHLIGQMHNTTKLIDKTIGTVRKISTELRPGILDDLGILAAIEWQLNDFQKRTNIRCEWISSLKNINLKEQATTAMFRIFQETLINVARHAGATEVKVQLRKEENAYFLEIADNGKGITQKNIDDKRSLGLLGMQERALAVAGRIDIKGHPGKGTKVIVEIPFKQTDNHNPSRGEESAP